MHFNHYFENVIDEVTVQLYKIVKAAITHKAIKVLFLPHPLLQQQLLV